MLNGTKIFCTSGLMAAEKSDGFVVVWATVDRSAGRAGIKPFVVEAGTPGMYVAKVEDKLGIRASDTATLVFEDCRIPLDNILGSPEVPKTQRGLQGRHGDLRRHPPDRAPRAPSASAAPRSTSCSDTLKERGIEVRYGLPPHQLTALERDFMDMEAQLQAARLLTWRAAWMMDSGHAEQPRGLDVQGQGRPRGDARSRRRRSSCSARSATRASCCSRSGCATRKINDIFEGTQQINQMIIARRILGYSSQELS